MARDGNKLPGSDLESEAAQRLSFHQVGAKDLAHRLHIDHAIPLRHIEELPFPIRMKDPFGVHSGQTSFESPGRLLLRPPVSCARSCVAARRLNAGSALLQLNYRTLADGRWKHCLYRNESNGLRSRICDFRMRTAWRRRRDFFQTPVWRSC